MYLSNTTPIVSFYFFFFSSRRRHTRFDCDWSSDVCSSDLPQRSAVRHKLSPSRPGAARQRLDKSRVIGRISQRLPQLVDRRVQAVVEINEGISKFSERSSSRVTTSPGRCNRTVRK